MHSLPVILYLEPDGPSQSPGNVEEPFDDQSPFFLSVSQLKASALMVAVVSFQQAYQLRLQNGLAVADGHVRTRWTFFLHLLFLAAGYEVTIHSSRSPEAAITAVHSPEPTLCP